MAHVLAVHPFGKITAKTNSQGGCKVRQSPSANSYRWVPAPNKPCTRFEERHQQHSSILTVTVCENMIVDASSEVLTGNRIR